MHYCRRFASRAQQVQNVVKVNCISENPPACAADAEARAKRVRSFGLRVLLVAFRGTNRPDKGANGRARGAFEIPLPRIAALR